MTTLTHPIDVIEEWIVRFSPRERGELAELVIKTISSSLPAEEQSVDTISLWTTRVKSLPPRQSVGHILSFCAAVEFFIIHDRGSYEGWDHLALVNESVKNALLHKGHSEQFVSPITEALLEMPMRRKRWLQQAERWRTLRKTTLSETSLHQWLSAKDRAWLLVPL